MRYTVAQCQTPEDDHEVLDLWTRLNVRRTGDPEGYLGWMYRENPAGPGFLWLARDSSGRVVGSIGLMPRRFSLDGRELLGGQAIDLIVEPAHRTVRAALMLHRTMIGEARRMGFDFLYGFPNRKAEKVTLRAGYQVLAPLRRWSRMIRSRDLMRRRIRWKFGAAVGSTLLDAGLTALSRIGSLGHTRDPRCSLDHRFSDDINEVWNRAATRAGVVGRRDSSFLKWRFGSRGPTPRVLRVEGHTGILDGYVLFRTSSGGAQVQDLFSSNPERHGRMLRAFVRWGSRSGLASVSVTSLMGSASLRGLRRMGFVPRPLEGTVVVLPLPHMTDVDRRRLLDPGAWFLTLADRDA